MLRKLRSGVLLLGALALLLASCGQKPDSGDSITGLVLVPGSLELEVGESSDPIAVSLTYERRDPVPLEVAAVEWTSSDDEVATVDGGVVTGVAVGSAAVTVRHEESGVEMTAQVTVVEPEPTDEEPGGDEKPGGDEQPGGDQEPGGEEPGLPKISVYVHAEKAELYVGESTSLSAEIVGTENKSVSWSVAPEGALRLESDGAHATITALAAASPARITATSTDESGAKGEAEVTVLAVPGYDSANVFVGKTSRLQSAPLGTEPNPFRTISAALASPLDDDANIHVAAGSYRELESIELVSHRLRGAGSSSTTISVVGPNCSGISVSGSDGTVISGIFLDVSELASAPLCQWVRGIHLVETVNATVEEVIVMGAEDRNPDRKLEGIGLWKTEDTLVKNSAVINTQRSGIGVNGGTNITLQDITVRNAGQGAGHQFIFGTEVLPSQLMSGYGALGLFADDNSGTISNLLLAGDFQIEQMQERLALNVDLADGMNVSLTLDDSFIWNAASASIPLVLQFDMLSLAPGAVPQLAIHDGYEELIKKLHLTHVSFDSRLAVAFPSEEAAVEFGTSAMDLLERDDVLVFELETPSETSSTAAATLKNVLAMQAASGRASDLQKLVDLVKASQGLISDGIRLTEGTYQGQIVVDASMSISGAGRDAVTVAAPAANDFVAINGFFPILQVSGTDTNLTLSDFTIDAEVPTCGNEMSAGLFIINKSQVVAERLNVENVGSADKSACPPAQGIALGRMMMNQAGGDFTGNQIQVTMSLSGKNGVYVDDNASIFELTGSVIQGVTTFSGHPGQNGIQVTRGSIDLTDTHVKGFRFDETWDDASAILLWPWIDEAPEGSALLTDTILEGNDNGIGIMYDNPVRIQGVEFRSNYTSDIINASRQTIDLTGRGVLVNGVPLTDGLADADAFPIARRIVDGINYVPEASGECDLGIPSIPCAEWGPVRWRTGALYVLSSGRLDRAIELADEGDKIILEPNSNFAERVPLLNLEKDELTLVGNDSALAAAVITANKVTVRDLSFDADGLGSDAVLSVEDAQGLTLENVSISADGQQDSLALNFVPKSGATADYSGFTMKGGVIKNAWIGIHLAHADEDFPISFQNVLIRDVKFENLAFKGIYLEAASNAQFQQLHMENVGNIGTYDLEEHRKYGAGVDLNLKYGSYNGLNLENLMIQDSAYSGGNYNLDGGVAVAVKAREDIGAGAILDRVTINGLTVAYTADELAREALRIGEPTKDNTGPTNVTVANSTLSAKHHAIANYSKNNIVDARVNNVLDSDEPVVHGDVALQ